MKVDALPFYGSRNGRLFMLQDNSSIADATGVPLLDILPCGGRLWPGCWVSWWISSQHHRSDGRCVPKHEFRDHGKCLFVKTWSVKSLKTHTTQLLLIYQSLESHISNLGLTQHTPHSRQAQLAARRLSRFSHTVAAQVALPPSTQAKVFRMLAGRRLAPHSVYASASASAKVAGSGHCKIPPGFRCGQKAHAIGLAETYLCNSTITA